MRMLIIYTFIFLSFFGCANTFENFYLEKTQVLIDQTMSKEYQHKKFKVFVDRLRDNSKLGKKEFIALREYFYATLEKIGHKRVYTRKEADFIIFFDMKIRGPYKLRRTGINKVWTNFKPEFNYGFKLDRIELEAAYDFLKRVRDIPTWKMHKEKFLFDNFVYISQVDIRAFDMTAVRSSNNVERAKIAWTSKIKSLAQSKNKKSHFSRIMVVALEKLGQEDIELEQSSIYNNDTRIRDLKHLVLSEKFYQDQRKNKTLNEEYRHLTNEEFTEFYTNRERPYSLDPLYRN